MGDFLIIQSIDFFYFLGKINLEIERVVQTTMEVQMTPTNAWEALAHLGATIHDITSAFGTCGLPLHVIRQAREENAMLDTTANAVLGRMSFSLADGLYVAKERGLSARRAVHLMGLSGCCVPDEDQDAVRTALSNAGFDEEEIKSDKLFESFDFAPLARQLLEM